MISINKFSDLPILLSLIVSAILWEVSRDNVNIEVSCQVRGIYSCKEKR